MKINWSKYLFFKKNRKRINNIIGKDILAICRFDNYYMVLDGICLSIKSKNYKLLTTSIKIKKREENYFVMFPLFLSGVINLKLIGISYGFKINCSKLTIKRMK